MMNEAFEQARAEIKPTSFLDYKLFLSSFYAFLKQKLGRYSYQRYATDLGFSATNIIHQIIKGHRPLSPKTGAKIAAAIGLKGDERRYFEALISYCNETSPAKIEDAFQEMLRIKAKTLPNHFERDCLEYYSEWYHPVIREMVGMADFSDDAKWIAEKITPRIRPEQARKSLELLERLNLIRFDEESGRFQQTSKRVSTGHRVRGMAVANFHLQMIDIARSALTKAPSHQRDFSAMTIKADAATSEKIKAMIHEFQMRVLDVSESAESGDQVFQVNIQFFPFT